jgi:hypothetical protein
MCLDPQTAALADVCSSLLEFECVEGDRTSYHTTPDGEKYPYSTIGFRSAQLHQAAAAMCSTLQALRHSMKGPKPVLYRRIGPSIERDPESNEWLIRIRVAIPGADWSECTTKPEGLPYPQA